MSLSTFLLERLRVPIDFPSLFEESSLLWLCFGRRFEFWFTYIPSFEFLCKFTCIFLSKFDTIQSFTTLKSEMVNGYSNTFGILPPSIPDSKKVKSGNQNCSICLSEAIYQIAWGMSKSPSADDFAIPQA